MPPIGPLSTVSVQSFEQPALGGDAGDALGHADAEVRDRAGLQFVAGAGGDDAPQSSSGSGCAGRVGVARPSSARGAQ